jgi:hypothetical protein
MRTHLLNLLAFAIWLIWLLFIYTLGVNGFRVAAAVAIALMVAAMFFWNKKQSTKLQADRVTSLSNGDALSPNIKLTIKFLQALFFVSWLVAIIIGAGIFGRSANLSYAFNTCCAVGLGSGLFASWLKRASK